MGSGICLPLGTGGKTKPVDRGLPSTWIGKYETLETIGEGMSGKVYRVKIVGDDEQYLANKVMPFTEDLLPDEIEDMRRECRLLKTISHPQIIKYVDHLEEGNTLYLVTELLRGKELFEFITSREKYLESDARSVTRALLKALKYLHDQNIAHRDIKPENMILGIPNDVESVKLIDFGLASVIQDTKHGITKAAGTPGYLPPEALKRAPRYGLPADVWAVGIIAYIMLCGYPPFYGDTDINLFRNIRNKDVEFDEADWVGQSQFARDFVLKLLNKDPEKRLTVDECLKHAWMTTEDEKLKGKNMVNTIENLKRHVARARLKKSIKAVMFANRMGMRKLGETIANSLEGGEK